MSPLLLPGFMDRASYGWRLRFHCSWVMADGLVPSGSDCTRWPGLGLCSLTGLEVAPDRRHFGRQLSPMRDCQVRSWRSGGCVPSSCRSPVRPHIAGLGKEFAKELEEFLVNVHRLKGKEYRILTVKGPSTDLKCVKHEMTATKSHNHLIFSGVHYTGAESCSMVRLFLVRSIPSDVPNQVSLCGTSGRGLPWQSFTLALNLNRAETAQWLPVALSSAAYSGCCCLDRAGLETEIHVRSLRP